MTCPACDRRVEGKRCACGWQDASIRPESSAMPTCTWLTEERHCLVRATSAGLCAWHRTWLRLIEDGAPGRTEQDEFAEWWEQYQPYGPYGGNPGQWWAAIDVLWAALRGLRPVPLLTRAIERELFVRQSEVHRLMHDLPLPVRPPWPRVSGAPLPPWQPEDWHTKVAARQSARART